VVFALAAEVCRWPELLRHYRYVRELGPQQMGGGDEQQRLDMGASRSGIPVRWTSVQTVYPQDRRIVYHHTGGVTRGMDVVWRIDPQPDGVEVTIEHRLEPSRWWLRPRAAQYVVGHIFIVHIADRTLRGLKRHAEARSIGLPTR
jgi:hypothetical protein